MQGKIKWFSIEKGYGFITNESGDDHYYNVQNIKGVSLPSIGDRVEFEPQTGDKGLRAINVEITSTSVEEESKSTDDRINCPSCYKKIVPRMITYHGRPNKSVCPYCGTTIQRFASNIVKNANDAVGMVVFFVFAAIIIGALVNM